MFINSKITTLLIIISLNVINNSKYTKQIPMSNKDFLFINEKGIYFLNENI